MADSSLSYRYGFPTHQPAYDTIPNRIRELAKHGDRNAFVTYDEDGNRLTLTFSDFYKSVAHFARHLVKLGVRKGDYVGVFCTTSIEWPVVEFGAMFCGAVALNNYASSTMFDVIMALGDKMPVAVIDLRQKQNAKDHILTGLQKLKESSSPPHVILIDYQPVKGYLDYNDIMSRDAEPTAEDVHFPDISPEDTALTFPTSGSTGTPKLVLWSHAAVLNLGLSGTNLGLKENDVMFFDRPMGYVGGFPYFVIALGIPHISVARPLIGPDSAAKLCHIAMREEVTAALLPPYVMHDLIKLKNEKNLIISATPSKHQNGVEAILPSNDERNLGHFKIPEWPSVGRENTQKVLVLPGFRVVHVGGQRLTKQMLTSFLDFTDEIYTRYGSTEVGWTNTIRITSSDMNVELTDIAGHPVPGCELKVIDENGDTVEVGEMGEVCVRGLSSGVSTYLHSDGTTTRFRDDRGWFHVSDIGVIKEGGNLYIKGRKTEMIKRASIKIFPAEGELVLREHPTVEEVFIVGVPDEKLLQEICACVMIRDGTHADIEELREYAKSRFHPEAAPDGMGIMPKYFLIMDEIPLLQTQRKPDRRAIAEWARAKLGL